MFSQEELTNNPEFQGLSKQDQDTVLSKYTQQASPSPEQSAAPAGQGGLSWDEISASPEFKNLSPPDRQKVSQKYQTQSAGYGANRNAAPRSAVGEIFTGLKKGALTAESMAGQSLQYLSSPGNPTYETGTKLVESARETEAQNPERYQTRPKQHGAVVNALTAGAEMIVPSMGPSLAAGAAIAAAPIEIPALAAAGLASLASVVPFALSQGQQTYENVKKAGGTEEQAIRAGRINAFIEGAGEEAAGLFELRFLGKALKIFGAGKVVGETAENVLGKIAKPKAMREFLKDALRTQAIEVGTEFGQNYGEAKVEKAYGVKSSQTPFQAGLSVIPATVGMGILLLPFGGLSAAKNFSENRKIVNALQDPEAPEGDRLIAATYVASQIKPVDKQAASTWAAAAAQAIEGKEPINLGKPIAQTMQEVRKTALEKTRTQASDTDLKVLKGNPATLAKYGLTVKDIEAIQLERMGPVSKAVKTVGANIEQGLNAAQNELSTRNLMNDMASSQETVQGQENAKVRKNRFAGLKEQMRAKHESLRTKNDNQSQERMGGAKYGGEELGRTVPVGKEGKGKVGAGGNVQKNVKTPQVAAEEYNKANKAKIVFDSEQKSGGKVWYQFTDKDPKSPGHGGTFLVKDLNKIGEAHQKQIDKFTKTAEKVDNNAPVTERLAAAIGNPEAAANAKLTSNNEKEQIQQIVNDSVKQKADLAAQLHKAGHTEIAAKYRADAEENGKKLKAADGVTTSRAVDAALGNGENGTKKAIVRQKTYDEIQKEIDDKTTKLMKSGKTLKEADSSPEIKALYEKRDAIGNQELTKSHKEIKERINSILHDDKLTSDILKKYYSLNPKSQFAQYFASEYTVKSVKETETAVKGITRELIAKEKEMPLHDIDLLFGNNSSLTDKGKTDLLQRNEKLARKINNTIKEYLGLPVPEPTNNITQPAIKVLETKGTNAEEKQQAGQTKKATEKTGTKGTSELGAKLRAEAEQRYGPPVGRGKKLSEAITSPGEKVSNPADTHAELESKHGAAVVSALEKKGLLNIVEPDEAQRLLEEPTAKTDIKLSADGKRIEGFIHNGKAYLVNGNIEKGQAATVFAHELGSHLYLENTFTGKNWDSITNSFKALENTGTNTGKAIRKAIAMIPVDTPAGNYESEKIAYYIGDQANQRQTLYRRILAHIKNALVKIGVPAGILKPADLAVIAEAGIRRMALSARESNISGRTPVFSLAGKAIQHVTGKMLKSDAFKKWFGNSAIKTKLGEPAIVWHGTTNQGFLQEGGSWIFNRQKEVGGSHYSPLAALGNYFTEDKAEALGYAGPDVNVHSFYISMQKPLVLNSWELNSLKTKAEVAAYAKRMQDLGGYDGIILKDLGHIIVFNPSNIKSAEINTGEFNSSASDVRFSKSSGINKAIEKIIAPVYYDPVAGTIDTAMINLSKAKVFAKDFSEFDTIFRTPEHYYYKIPSAHRYLDIVLNRRDKFEHMRNNIIGDFPEFGKKLKKTALLRYNFLSNYLDKHDKFQYGYKIKYADDKFIVEPPKKSLLFKYPESGLKLEKSFDTEQEAVDFMIRQESSDYMKSNPDATKEEVALMMDTRRATNEGFNLLSQQLRDRIAKAKQDGQKMPTVTIRDKKGESKQVNLREVLDEIGDLRGSYMPRIRKRGSYSLIAERKNKNGEIEHYSQNYDAYLRNYSTDGNAKAILKNVLNKATPIAKKARELEADGYTIKSIKLNSAMPEELFNAANLVTAVENMIKTGVQRAEGVEGSVLGSELDKAVNESIADMFRMRGFRSVMMKRNSLLGASVYKGYETDLIKRVVQYSNNTAAGIAKRDMARGMVMAITGRDKTWAEFKKKYPNKKYSDYQEFVRKRGIDPVKQPTAYADIMSHMNEMLRNDDAVDRIVSTAKGLACLKYLGFRVSSGFINVTNMVMNVPAAMVAIGHIPYLKSFRLIGQGMKDYSKWRTGQGKISEENKAALDYIHEQNWDEALFNKDAYTSLLSQLEGKWHNFTAWSMWVFGETERLNRGSTILAAYNGIKPTSGWGGVGIDEKRMSLAHEVSDKAHGVYDKGTRPAVTRGSGLGPAAMRASYTFMKFQHNFLQLLGAVSPTGHLKSKVAFAHMLISPAIIGGAGASLLLPVLTEMAKALGIGGDDPEEAFYKWAGDTFNGADFARFGVPGLVGVSIKGSLAINGPPTTLEGILGAPYSVFADEYKAASLLGRGDFMKAAEKALPTGLGAPIRAYREATEGVTSKSNLPLFYGAKAVHDSPAEAMWRVFGFAPKRTSKIREQQWNEKVVMRKHSARKKEIYNQYRKVLLDGGNASELGKVFKEIESFNLDVMHSGRPDIRMITRGGLSSALRRFYIPPKRELLRSVNQ